MKPSLLAALGLAMLAVSACSSTSDARSNSSARGTSSVPERGLPAQQLAYGSCGLFLWSLSGEPTFTFFSEATTGRATMLIGDRARDLSQTGAGGDIFGQFTTRQVFNSPSTSHTVDVQVEPGESLIDGQRVDSGRIKLTDADGWETVIPVSGVRACRERPDPTLGDRSR